MKKIFTILGAMAILCVLQATIVFAEVKEPNEATKTQVVIIGTIHSAHHKNTKYSPDILKGIILVLKPDVILNELPLSLVDPNGRPLIKLKDNSCPEVWAADQSAQELGIRQIPFDRPDREEYRKKTNFYKKREQSSEARDNWLKQIEKDNPGSVELKISNLQEYAGQAQDYLWLNAGPELINSEGFDSIVRIKDSVWEDILPVFIENDPRYKHTTDDLHFLINEWKQRNRIMADNIIKAAKEYPDKRLVVVTGATHRYILRDLLKDEPCIDLKEYWDVIDIKPNQVDNAEQSTGGSKTLIQGRKDKIKDIVASVASNKGSSSDRTVKLIKWMNENFEWTSTDYKQRTVEEIIQRRGGNCAEQARVLMALLEAADIKARWVEEINIHPKRNQREEDAKKLIAEHGNKFSVFGYMHNDHRWLEVYDNAIDAWVPADPTLGVFGVNEWVRSRLGFGERPKTAKDMLVPFVLIIRQKGHLVENRSEHYLINEFNAYYGNDLKKLPAWPRWVSNVNELSKLGAAAFAGEINLHEHTKLMMDLEQAYLDLKKEQSSKEETERAGK